MISIALYIRKEFEYFCNKPVDKPHQNFIQSLNRINKILYNKNQT